MKSIHWYPGHMQKALIEITERVKIVDVVIELVDSRAPLASINPLLEKASANKRKLVVLTKSDLSDDCVTDKWISYFNKENVFAIAANLNSNGDINKIIHKIEELGSFKREKEIKQKMKPQPIRAMIIGIPNVGKSSLINKLAKRNAASVANTPGHTKAQQWIKISNSFELLDTPGILPKNFEDKKDAVKLALIGSIKEEILPISELADELLNYLKENYITTLYAKYDIEVVQLSNQELLQKIAKRRGLISSGQEDILKAEQLLLHEFKNGIIGKMSLERP